MPAHVCLDLVVVYWPLVGTCIIIIQFVHVIATLNSTIVSSYFFILAFANTHITFAPLPPMPLQTLAPILMNYVKKLSKNSENQPLLLARLVVHKLKVLLC